MGEYYTDEEIDSILNRYAKIEEQVVNLLGYAKSIEQQLEASRSKTENLSAKYADLLDVAKELYFSLYHEVGTTRLGEKFRIKYMENK